MNLYFFYAQKDGMPFNRLVAAPTVQGAVKLFPKVDRVENIYQLAGQSTGGDKGFIFDEGINDWVHMQAQRGVLQNVSVDEKR